MTVEDLQASVNPVMLRKFVAGCIEAWNTKDLDRFVAYATEDVVMDHSAWPTRLEGRADLRDFYARNWAAFPDITLEVADGPFLHPSAPQAVVMWRAVGTHTGPIDPPGFAPTGKRVEVTACHSFEFRGDLVCRARIVMDMTAFMRQIGLAPAAGGRMEQAMAAAQRLSVKASNLRLPALRS